MTVNKAQLAQLFVNSLPEAAICIDRDQTILATNTRLAKLYDSTCQDLQQKALSELLVIDADTPFDASSSENNANCLYLRTRKQALLPVQLQISLIEIPELAQCRLLTLVKTRFISNVPDKVLQLSIDRLDDGVFISIFDYSGSGRHGQFVAVNDTACKALGYERAELLALNARSLNPPGNTETIMAVGRNLKRDGEASFNAIHVGKDGTHHAVQVHAKLINVDKQFYILSQCHYLDASKKLSSIDNSRFGRLLELSWDEIYVFDTTSLNFIQANTGALDNLGYSRSEITQLKITDLLQDISENTFHRLTEPLFDGKKNQLILESLFKRKDKTYYPVEIRLQLSHSEVPPVFLANTQDITERKKTESNLVYLANHDTLTGLFNRNTFIKKLDQEIESCRRSETLMAVMFLDLDGFKYINDTMGHDTGDQLIIETAKRLQASIRTTDTVARQGGDEFTIILTNIKHTNAIHLLAQKIIANISAPFEINGHQIKTSCSIGITVYPFTESDNAYLLIKQADTAMYQAKNQGKNTYSFYAATLAENELSQRELESNIHKAFEKNQFEIYYQPKVNLKNRQIIGAEALLRWPNSMYPDISPLVFIPVLEKNGLINKIDLWVFRQSCLYLRDWLKLNNQLVVSVNLSARQFENKTLVEEIKAILDETNVSASNLEIEITEGVLIAKADEAKVILNELKQLGLNISLDDFGSGYSSLSYLKQLPINRLKIDRTFVEDIENNHDSKAIIDAIINLADNLDLSIIAEGIETETQVSILTGLNCFEGQGYLFGKPCPAHEFEKLL